MKILHVISDLVIQSGSARMLVSLVPYFVKHGYQVDVLSLTSSESSYRETLEEMGCHCYTLGMKYGIDCKFRFYNILKLIPYLRHYDIVHAHLFPSLYWIVIAKLLSGADCKLVVTEHSSENNRQKFSWLIPIERFVYNHYNIIVAISTAVRNALVKNVAPKTPIVVIENGIDVFKFKQANPVSPYKLGLPDDAVLLIQVARFSREKDQATLLRALTLLPNKFHIMFVGIGELMDEYKRQVLALNLSNRVHFMGLRQDVPALIKSSYILIMSSHFEGFGLAAVEGMAAGKPVIASDVPGLADVVRGAGILFKSHDEHELAAYILKLSEDKEFYKEMSLRCFRRAEEFDVSIMNTKYESMYRNLTI